jgi:uncharacterized protein DUF6531
LLYRSLLRFNLSQNGQSIPQSSEVVAATVGLYSPSPAQNTSGVELREVTKGWDATANWSYYKKGTGGGTWTTPGGDYTSAGSEILTAQRGAQAGWWEFSAGLVPVVQKWASSAQTSGSFMLKLRSDPRECKVENGRFHCLERIAGPFASSAALDQSKRPYLDVVYYPQAPASSKVTSPPDGTRSARRFKLQASWSEAGVTGVTFQYARNGGKFTNIPPTAVQTAQGQAVSWPLAVQGKQSEPLYLDVAAIVENLRQVGPAPISIRAVFDGSLAASGRSAAVGVVAEPNVGGPRDATSAVGPGSVNLMTGNLTISRTDVSIPTLGSTLQFARTHNSLAQGATEDTNVLGRGWKPSIPVEEAGGAEWRIVREVLASEEEREYGIPDYAVLTDLEGYEYAFEKQGESFLSPPEFSGWRLSRSGATFTLADPAGNATTFESGAEANEYLPASISMPGGSSNATQMVYQLVNGNRRLSMVIGPSAPGVSCTSANATTASGCRSLTFSYLPATNWGAPATYKDRLAAITYYAPPGANGAMHWEVARYGYDSSGRLVEEWDPRVEPALKEKYTYLGAPSTYKGGQIATVTPAGEEPWTLEYEAAAETRPPDRRQPTEPPGEPLGGQDLDRLRSAAERVRSAL